MPAESTTDETQALTVTTQDVALARTASQASALQVEAITAHSLTVRRAMENVMKDGTHYGKIPGTPKPTLYQPGAQVLALTFKLRPSFEVTKTLLSGDHREVDVKTTITDAGGAFIGHGVGSCSTMESKYRYRKADGNWEATGQPVPKTYWALKNPVEQKRAIVMIMDDSSGNFGVRNIAKPGEKKDWQIVRYLEAGAVKENENLADVWNTVLKMAKKRSYVDAILNCTAASDVFTQDVEDLEENLDALQAATGQDYHSQDAAEDTAKEHSQQQKPAGTWVDAVVHIKSTVKGKRLGDLTLAHLRALKTGWIDKFDFTKSSMEDRQLRKAIVEGIVFFEAEQKLPTSGSSADETSQGTGLKNEQPRKGELLSPAEEAIASVKRKLASYEIEPETFVKELVKRGAWDPSIASNLDGVTHDEPYCTWLDGNLETYLAEMGFTQPPKKAAENNKPKNKAPRKTK